MERELPSPPELLERLGSKAALDSALPDRPVTSLRDLQYLYGRLYTLATAGDGEYTPYLTPDQARDLLDEQESLIIVRIDLTDERPHLDDTPVEVTSYSERAGHVEKVAHSYYDAARGVDHSVTHRSGREKTPEELAAYAQERLTRWATDEVVQLAADDHKDGWIIDALATLGEDDAVLARIHDEVTRKIGGPGTALLTVCVKRSGDGEYYWPGELDVFATAMKRRKQSKLVSKNTATESAGKATDMLTGKRTRTVGTAEDPLNYFLGKQLEKFPGLDADEAWRNHPISEETAVTIMNSEPFVEACTYNAFAATIYCLPYFFGTLDADRALELYGLLRNTMAEGDMTPIETAFDYYDSDTLQPTEFKFYVSAVQKQQAKRFDVFGETMGGDLLVPVALTTAHRDLLETWVFNRSAVPSPLRTPLPTHEKWQLLTPTDGLLAQIIQGWYFDSTFAPPDDESEAAVDDARIQALVSVLSGDPLSVRMLLGEYVERLLEAENESFPRYLVAAQFVQLCALVSEGLLVSQDESHDTIAVFPNYDDGLAMHDSSLRADGGSHAAARDRKLEQFINQTAAFDNSERRASFLLGALVGQIGGYQRGVENRSTTVVDQHSIKSMTKTKFKRITQRVLERDIVYSRKNDMSTTMYAEVVDRLRDALTENDPSTWTITTDDLRFYYALGISYGLNNWTETTPSEDRSTDTS